MAQGEKRGCFKVGCLGCLGIGAIVFVVVAVLLAIGLLTGFGDERFETIDQAHTLPVPPLAPGTPQAHVEEPGRIVLDVTRVSFTIRPGAPGESVRLEGEYDAGRFELDESIEPYGESGWIYRLRFEQQGFGIRPFVQEGELGNNLTLVIPRDTPVVLEGYVGIGQSQFELGGLWIGEIDLKYGVGEHSLSFDEPLPLPMKSLRLDTSIGVLNIDSLGNASPHRVEARHSVGETTIDLRGAWKQDADVRIWCGVGECDVRVPDDVNVELQRASMFIGESGSSLGRGPTAPEPDPEAPTISLSVSGKIGELNVRR